MPNPPTQSAADPPAEPTDLYCPQCEYNLHGITSIRCPECGTEINYEILAQICTLERQSLRNVLVPEAKNLWQVYWGLCALAWFHPRRLAERMPYRHSTRHALAFNLVNKATACLVISTIANAIHIGTGASSVWKETLAFTAIALLCTYMCEISIAFILKLLVKPRGRPDAPRFHFWWGLQSIMSCHSVVSATFGVVGYAILSVLDACFLVYQIPIRHQEKIGFAVGFQFFAVPFLYWWIVMNRMISVRGIGRAALAMIAIPIVVVVVIFCIYLVSIYAMMAWMGWL